MSYDINFKRKDLKNGQIEWIQLKEKHNIQGHMYNLDGTKEAWINITSNFFDTFEKAFGCPAGIKILHEKNVRECVDLVNGAIAWIQDNRGDEPLVSDPDPWKKTIGNAYVSLQKLSQLLQLVITDYPDYKDIVAHVGY